MCCPWEMILPGLCNCQESSLHFHLDNSTITIQVRRDTGLLVQGYSARVSHIPIMVIMTLKNSQELMIANRTQWVKGYVKRIVTVPTTNICKISGPILFWLCTHQHSFMKHKCTMHENILIFYP
jgi:hypothetical protein